MTAKQIPMKRKVLWAYCRVSTSKAEQELSLEQQCEWAKLTAHQRGCRLVVFSERASAKTIVNRPQCVRMLAQLAESKPNERPDAVIATSFDRLSRDISDTVMLARVLRDAGVELYIRDRGAVKMATFVDQVSLVGQAMGGHAENEARSNRAKASWERRRREGKPTSNKAPYGIQLRGERDTPAEHTAIWVLRAFEWYAAGIGTPTISQRFKAGAPSHRVATSKVDETGQIIYRERQPVWESNRIRKLLSQPRYRGLIVPEDLFDTVTERLKQIPRWSQKRNLEYPLSGALKCVGCGRSYHGHASGGVRKKRLADGSVREYPDAKRVRYYQCVVCNYSINADRIELEFRNSLNGLIARPASLRAWMANPRPGASPKALRADTARLTAAIAAIAKKRQRAWDLALHEDLGVANDLPDQLRRLNDEESNLRDELGRIESVLEGQRESDRTYETARLMLREFWPHYASATYEQKRELCNEIVECLGGAKASKDGLIWENIQTV